MKTPQEPHTAVRPARFHSDPRDPDRDRAELPLAAIPSAAGTARRFVLARLRTWDLDLLADACELVASELVTNALAAVRAPAAPADNVKLHDHPPPLIVLRLRLTHRRVFCEVWDPDPRSPLPVQAAGLDEGGRGLLLVAAAASDWGCYPSPIGVGKVVVAWWELRQ